MHIRIVYEVIRLCVTNVRYHCHLQRRFGCCFLPTEWASFQLLGGDLHETDELHPWGCSRLRNKCLKHLCFDALLKSLRGVHKRSDWQLTYFQRSTGWLIELVGVRRLRMELLCHGHVRLYD